MKIHAITICRDSAPLAAKTATVAHADLISIPPITEISFPIYVDV